MIEYVLGDATAPVGNGPRVIVHVCNDIGGWGAGFVLALSRRWPEPEAAYRQWFEGGGDLPFALGEVQFVEVGPELWVANLIGQRDVVPAVGVPPVRYDAIESGLRCVAEFVQAHKASVHMPRIGCGLAGGSWEEVERIVHRALVSAGVSVTVYDLPPRS